MAVKAAFAIELNVKDGRIYLVAVVDGLVRKLNCGWG